MRLTKKQLQEIIDSSINERIEDPPQSKEENLDRKTDILEMSNRIGLASKLQKYINKTTHLSTCASLQRTPDGRKQFCTCRFKQLSYDAQKLFHELDRFFKLRKEGRI